MASSPIDRVKSIFVEALEHSGAERASFLDRACAGESELRAQVEKYLLDEAQAGEFLSKTGLRRGATRDDLLNMGLREGPGAIIGRYKLLEVIGEGGFGLVFRAEQQTPVCRMVALKIIKLGMDTRQVIARFEAERQSLALLDHPNIAKVLDAGETATGRPYFVMELVDGTPITEYCDQNKLATEQRLALFTFVCNALQYAHQKGIIHRDIKPSNILVTLYDGKPVPKLIDFGIAKATQSQLTEKTLFTELRQLIGTPAYMSPEQAETSGLGVDTRSDIYSLGVLLYELITGTTPFDSQVLRSAAYAEIQRIIREVDPPKPSTRLSTLGESLGAVAANRSVDPRRIAFLVRGELDWIVMKAMEKDRTRRYESAGELARDIGRYLEDEPVEACPPSATYEARKFLWRHRKPVSLATGLVIGIVATGVTYVASMRAEQRKTESALLEARTQRSDAVRATERALAAETAANEELVASALSQAHGSRASILPGRRFDSLSALAAVAKIHPSVAVRSQAAGCLALADARVRNEWRGSGDGICFNHECTLFADQEPQTGDVLICRVPPAGADPGPPILRLHVKVWPDPVAFSRDDRLLAVSELDGHVRVYTLDGSLKLDIPNGPARDFTPDGTGLAVASPGGPVLIYDLSSGEPSSVVKIAAGYAILFSPDGGKLATWNGYGAPERDIDICELATGKVTRLPHMEGFLAVAWHPSGTRLAVGDLDGKIHQWDVAQAGHPLPLPTLSGHTAAVTILRFNHGGDLLASSSSDHSTRLWDAVSGEPQLRISGFGNLTFSSDDGLLALASYAQSKHQLLTVASGRERRTFLPPPGFNGHDTAFSSDGSIMACGGHNVVRFWNLSDPSPYVVPLDLPIDDNARQLAFNPDGTGWIVRADNGLWRISMTELPDRLVGKGSIVRRLQINPALVKLRTALAQGDGEIQYSTDGRRIAFAKWGQLPRVVSQGDPGRDLIFKSASKTSMWISLSPDGKWAATGKWHAETEGGAFVSVWNAQTGQKVKDLPSPVEARVAFSPDGKWLITCTQQEYRFWSVGSWNPGRSVSRNADGLWDIPFSTDSRTLAISPRNWGVQLIDSGTGAEFLTLDDLDEESPIAFTPDGGKLVTSCANGSIRLWDIRRIRRELGEMGLDWSAPPLPAQTAMPRIELSIGNPAR